jgi:predicted phosphodiesterase
MMSKTIETTVVLADIHIPSEDKKALSCAEKILAYVQPDRIVYLGDVLDLPELAKFNVGKRRILENLRVEKDYEAAQKMLDRHKKLAPNCKEWVFCEGNHELRAKTYLDENPEWEGLAEVQNGLDLAARGFKWIAYNRVFKLGKLYLTHAITKDSGHQMPRLYAHKLADMVGHSLMIGHTHTRQEFTRVGIMDEHDKSMVMSIPCLTQLNPEWAQNGPNSCLQGFAIVYTDKQGNFWHYVINIIDGKAIFNGKVFEG